jgi:hypothetical protein
MKTATKTESSHVEPMQASGGSPPVCPNLLSAWSQDPLTYADGSPIPRVIDLKRCYCPECLTDRNRKEVQIPARVKSRPFRRKRFCSECAAAKDSSQIVLPTPAGVDWQTYRYPEPYPLLLSPIKEQEIADFISFLNRRSSPIALPRVSTPLAGINFTETPEHWLKKYWMPPYDRTPSDEVSLLFENGMLPMWLLPLWNPNYRYCCVPRIIPFGRSYQVPKHKSTKFEREEQPMLKRRWSNPRFDFLPWAIDDSNQTLETPTPKATEYDKSRLNTGYRLHVHYYRSDREENRWYRNLSSWIHSEHTDEDPNLKCKLRYESDRRGRRGVKSKYSEFTECWEDKESGVSKASTIRRADKHVQFDALGNTVERHQGSAEYHDFESQFIEKYHIDFGRQRSAIIEALKPTVSIVSIPYDTPEQTTSGNIQKPYMDGKWDTKNKRLIESTTQPYRDARGREKEIGGGSKDQIKGRSSPPRLPALMHAKFEQKLKDAWKDPTTDAEGFTWGWISDKIPNRHGKYLSPNSRRCEVVDTVSRGHGAKAEAHAVQVKKVRVIKPTELSPAAIKRHKSVVEILVRKKTLKQVAEERGTSKNTVSKMVGRHLKSLTAATAWAKALAKMNGTVEDGVYAVCASGGKPRVYLIVPKVKILADFDDSGWYTLLADGLHNRISDLLYERAKRGRFKDGLSEAEYSAELQKQHNALFEEFNRFGWRFLKNGKWYNEEWVAA